MPLNMGRTLVMRACERLLVEETKQCLTRRFGTTPAVSVMLAHIDGIVREFSRAGLAVACT